MKTKIWYLIPVLLMLCGCCPTAEQSIVLPKQTRLKVVSESLEVQEYRYYGSKIFVIEDSETGKEYLVGLKGNDGISIVAMPEQ